MTIKTFVHVIRNVNLVVDLQKRPFTDSIDTLLGTIPVCHILSTEI